jgi:glycosyltransferase involved in cell wall biosynthesis
MKTSMIEFHRTSERPLLSVCISVKNRSRIIHAGRELTLFPRCVCSLVQAASEFSSRRNVELVVVDHQSDDWPLPEWVGEAIGGLPARFVFKPGDYSRGEGLNLAAASASSDWLFLCDADMLVTGALLTRGVEFLSQGTAFFPLRRCMNEDGSLQDLDAYHVGNAFVTRRVFEQVGGVPQFKSWGGDDDIFFHKVAERVKVRREHIPGFHHLWHPDRCRHENYAKPSRSDFEESSFLASRRAGRFDAVGSVAQPDGPPRPRREETAPQNSPPPMLTCLCATYKRPKLLATILATGAS